MLNEKEQAQRAKVLKAVEEILQVVYEGQRVTVSEPFTEGRHEYVKVAVGSETFTVNITDSSPMGVLSDIKQQTTVLGFLDA